MIHPDKLLYIPTLKEGRLPMIALEEVPGSGIIHDASTLTWVPLNGVEEYLNRNYVIIDDPDQVGIFEKLQKETKRKTRPPLKAGQAALSFAVMQFSIPVVILIGIYVLSLVPPFHQSIGPFDRPTAELINNASVMGIAGMGGAYAFVRVFREVDFKTAPLYACAGLLAGIAWLGLVIFRLLVV
jgi:hypothetical protein